MNKSIEMNDGEYLDLQLGKNDDGYWVIADRDSEEVYASFDNPKTASEVYDSIVDFTSATKALWP